MKSSIIYETVEVTIEFVRKVEVEERPTNLRALQVATLNFLHGCVLCDLHENLELFVQVYVLLNFTLLPSCIQPI